MFVAVWRYSAALSLVLGAGMALAQPALAHGRLVDRGMTRHHHHHAFLRAASARFHNGQARVYRHEGALVEAPALQVEMQVNGQSSPQDYWQHGWRGHAAKQNAWQQTNGQQNAWQQEDGQRESRRQRRLAQRQQAAFYSGAAPGYTSTYYDYAQQSSSWSSYGGGFGGQSALSGMIAQAASTAGVPLSLAERVVRRESGGNPRAVHAGNYGLMQIRLGTARAMGYGGSAAGLLDPSVNMTYAMRYLAGAYRAAGGSESRAVALYARGYHATPARVRTYTF